MSMHKQRATQTQGNLTHLDGTVKAKVANADVRDVDPSQLSTQMREALPVVGTAPATKGTAS
jgi:hypothetical protein